MKCLSCDRILSDRESSRKFTNWREMPEGEDRYIGLCDRCIVDTDLHFDENTLANDEDLNEDTEEDVFRDRPN